MAAYDTADLVSRFRVATNLPDVDESTPTEVIYQFLTDAQQYWYGQLSVHAPEVVQTAYEPMSTTDGGRTYSVSQDIAGPLTVMDALHGVMLIPGSPWDAGADYHQEGPRTIRMNAPGGRTFSGGAPLARYVPAAGVIDQNTQPTLQPAFARQLIVYHAAYLWALRGGERDPRPYLQAEQRAAWGDPQNPGSVGIIAQLKARSNVFGGPGDSGLWWRTPDFGPR